MELSKEHIEIIKHSVKSPQGLFCGGGKEMDELCDEGLMEYVGKKSFVPDPYYRATGKGRESINQQPIGIDDAYQFR